MCITTLCVGLLAHLFGPVQPYEPTPLWQKRFYDFNARTKQKHIECRDPSTPQELHFVKFLLRSG